MIGIILENEEAKEPHIMRLMQEGYAECEVPDLYVKGRNEVLLLVRGALSVKETLFLDFMPQIGCELTHNELKVVDFIRLRHLSSISVQTNPSETILAQLFT